MPFVGRMPTNFLGQNQTLGIAYTINICRQCVGIEYAFLPIVGSFPQRL